MIELIGGSLPKDQHRSTKMGFHEQTKGLNQARPPNMCHWDQFCWKFGRTQLAITHWILVKLYFQSVNHLEMGILSPALLNYKRVIFFVKFPRVGISGFAKAKDVRSN